MGEQLITSPIEISEAFNNYFSTVGSNLASDIVLTENGPEYYLKPTNSMFSLKTPSVDTVYKLLTKIDEKKSVGLNKIPSELLKIAADVRAFFNYITGGAKAPPAPMVAPPLNHFGPPSQSPFSLKYKQNMEFRREV